MGWTKLGLLYKPDSSLYWSKTHSYCPTAFVKDNGNIMVYFSSWDVYGRGRIGYVELDKNDPTKIIKVSKEPVIDLGNPGMFDCDGVAPSQVFSISDSNIVVMYYFGFQRTTNENIHLIFAGMAFSSDGGYSFLRAKSTPVLERTDGESVFRSSLFLDYDESGCVDHKLYYTTSLSNPEKLSSSLYNNKSFPYYGIKQAYVNNLQLYGFVSRDFLLPTGTEFGICRPWIFYNKKDSCYNMLYSVRSLDCNYRIGCLSSKDKNMWEKFGVVLDVSNHGWDSEMVCFSSVFEANGSTFMLYNGNNHGKNGFGLAILT